MFSGHLSYSEVWGAPEDGLTPIEETEIHLAYDEYDRHQRSERSWSESKDPDKGSHFDNEAHRRARLDAIDALDE